MLCGKPLARCVMHWLRHTRRMLPVSQRPGRQQIRQIQAGSQARGMADWADSVNAALPLADDGRISTQASSAATAPLQWRAALALRCPHAPIGMCNESKRRTQHALPVAARHCTKPAHSNSGTIAPCPPSPPACCTHMPAIAKSSQAVSARCFWAKCD